MFFAEKRIKLSSSINNKHKNISGISIDQGIESDNNSQVDLASTADFSLPTVTKRKISRKASFGKKHSFDNSEQTSLGYGSLLSSASSSLSPRKSIDRTPKKRKSSEVETDENAFYNSYQFVSPLKIRSRDCAKLILKEKCSSENVILSSTPIRNNNKKKLWGKFRSLHQEKFKTSESIEDTEPFEKFANLPSSTNVTFDDGSSFELTNSFNITSNVEQQDSNIPSNLQQLWTGSINKDAIAKHPVRPTPTETITKPQEQVESIVSQSSNVSSSSRPRTRYHCGRLKMDILGKLHMEQNLAFKTILSHCSDLDILSLSHVSKDYLIMIKSNKPLETRRQSYLKAQQALRENKAPGSLAASVSKSFALKSPKKALGESNINHSMQLRPKPVSPPVSPSRKRFYENQQLVQSYSGVIKKCPRCSKPAKINRVRIRSSPRKHKKCNILKISSGRVQKRSKTFLAKPSIDTQVTTDQLYVTFPSLDDSNCSTSASPSLHSSDESSGSGSETSFDAEMYEYGECSGPSCNFKFCVKCNCKYHPCRICKDFSPASPTRIHFTSKSSVACSTKSLKSLKRLVY